MTRTALEICVETGAGMDVARIAGADRIELCAALGLGGLTPGPGLIAEAARCGLPVHAMVRPRAGDFAYDAADMRACLTDIAAIRAAGLAGVVVGVAQAVGALHLDHLAALVAAAGPMEVTLHRVIDLVPDHIAAVEAAVGLGVTRILTSGQAPTAGQGCDVIARMVRQAAGRIEIMAGGGVTPEAVPDLCTAGVDAIHASCGVPTEPASILARIGLAPVRNETSAERIAALRAKLDERVAA